MDKATPTPSPASVDKQAALVAKLRYMGKQYAAGQVARGGAPQKHYLEEAAEEIEMMAWALSMNTKTPASAQENADLRNVIQAACIDGLPGLSRAWEKYFPDHPITIKGAEVERLAAQAAPTLLDAFKSGNAILIDWPMEPVTPQESLKLMDMMDAEYAKTIGKPAPDREMAICMQRVQHMACDLWASQKEVIRAHFVELAAAQAPVVQAVQAVELIEQEMAMLIRRLCSTTANDKTRAQAMEYLFKRGHASPLRADSDPAQAMDHPPLPEGVKARFKCEDCDGTGYTGEMIPGSEFQPPEPVGCTSCRFTGWWAECEAYSADQMHAYVDADRASSCAAQAAPFAKDSWQHAVDNQLVAFGRTSQEFANPHEALAWLAIVNMELGQSNVGAAQAVRMLTEPEIKALTAMVWGAPCSGRDLAIVTSIVRAVEALQPGERPIDPAKGGRLLDVDACIPADGKIGSAA